MAKRRSGNEGGFIQLQLTISEVYVVIKHGEPMKKKDSQAGTTFLEECGTQHHCHCITKHTKPSKQPQASYSALLIYSQAPLKVVVLLYI